MANVYLTTKCLKHGITVLPLTDSLTLEVVQSIFGKDEVFTILEAAQVAAQAIREAKIKKLTAKIDYLKSVTF